MQNNNQNGIISAIIIVGVLIAGAILLRGTTPTTNTGDEKIVDENKITKSTPLFSTCLDSGKYTQAVADTTSAGSKNGVTGTPKGFILKDNKVVATIDGAEPTTTISQKIENALSEKAKEIPNTKIDLITNSDFVLGNIDARVAVILYADFQCIYCIKFFKETKETIIKSYIQQGKIKFVHRDFAFLGNESIKSAEAARCAGDQGKFWEYHDYLYNYKNSENQGNFSNLNLKLFAQKIGLK
ncbi:MAG: thioredoxin domain-containing protein [Candidatus Paceibacterota bacterium]